MDVPLLFDRSRPGRTGVALPACDVPDAPLETLIPVDQIRAAPPPLPELGELDLVRHYTRLSQQNMSVDTHFYPLGSCTMKYNPKRNERAASLPGLARVHPYQHDDTLQGTLALLWHLERALAEISGLDRVSLQPAAGAHGELTSLLVASAYFKDIGQHRTKVLIPDSAHGTNPASAALAGFDTVPVRSNEGGLVDLADVEHKLDESVGVMMLTNPNTLGLFDPQVGCLAAMLHQQGALLYLDGANMNAVLGVARPGDMGVDLMHFNPHKTFSGPHGAGGPGAGPIGVRGTLAPYLPVPTVERDGDRFRLDHDRPKSIGRVRSFFGQTGVLIRAYAYIRTLGPDGLRRVAENAVLNANYVLARVKDHLHVPYGERCMHEFVATTRGAVGKDVRAMDVAKRLIDFGFHPPTMYFPLIVPEALMIEPTETESKETLDAFIEAVLTAIKEPPDTLHDAPHHTPVSRPDEVAAARRPCLRWTAPGTGE